MTVAAAPTLRSAAMTGLVTRRIRSVRMASLRGAGRQDSHEEARRGTKTKTSRGSYPDGLVFFLCLFVPLRGSFAHANLAGAGAVLLVECRRLSVRRTGLENRRPQGRQSSTPWHSATGRSAAGGCGSAAGSPAGGRPA